MIHYSRLASSDHITWCWFFVTEAKTLQNLQQADTTRYLGDTEMLETMASTTRHLRKTQFNLNFFHIPNVHDTNFLFPCNDRRKALDGYTGQISGLAGFTTEQGLYSEFNLKGVQPGNNCLRIRIRIELNEQPL